MSALLEQSRAQVIHSAAKLALKAGGQTLEPFLGAANAAQPMPADVTIRDFRSKSYDGSQVMLRWYEKKGATSGAAALYLHGGGMILGSVSLFDGPVARYVSASSVSMLSVEYRRAPEHPHPAPVEDAYAGLTWLAEHTAELAIDPSTPTSPPVEARSKTASMVRLPSRVVKYIASGLAAWAKPWIALGSSPLAMPALPLSTGIWTFINTRMLSSP